MSSSQKFLGCINPIDGIKIIVALETLYFLYWIIFGIFGLLAYPEAHKFMETESRLLIFHWTKQ
jgi:hypothetical protein